MSFKRGTDHCIKKKKSNRPQHTDLQYMRSKYWGSVKVLCHPLPTPTLNLYWSHRMYTLHLLHFTYLYFLFLISITCIDTFSNIKSFSFLYGHMWSCNYFNTAKEMDKCILTCTLTFYKTLAKFGTMFAGMTYAPVCLVFVSCSHYHVNHTRMKISFLQFERTLKYRKFINVRIFETKPCSWGLILAVSSGPC